MQRWCPVVRQLIDEQEAGRTGMAEKSALNIN
jgi:hypothetical protein